MKEEPLVALMAWISAALKDVLLVDSKDGLTVVCSAFELVAP